MMKIVADSNLQGVEELFSNQGELHLLPGRDISSHAILNADALLVRSVTQVNASLLQGTSVRFIGSATSGIEHVDTDYLKNHGIGFADAKGANAQAVVDYCLSALAHAEINEHSSFTFDGARIGIVGLGFVGGLLARTLRTLGLEVSAYDPLLEASKTAYFESLGVVFKPLHTVFESDAVSVHVPLTDTGPDATIGFIDRDLLQHLPRAGVFINACRGGVANESALLEISNANNEQFIVLDVWSNEPVVNLELLARANLATPHIAGYSAIAKAAATIEMKKKFLQYFSPQVLPELEPSGINLAKVYENGPIDLAPNPSLAHVLCAALPIQQWSKDFKNGTALASKTQRPALFDSFRKAMISRAQFANCSIDSRSLPADLRVKLSDIGFAET